MLDTQIEQKRLGSAADLEAWRQIVLSGRRSDVLSISICGGTGCRACGCLAVADVFRAEIQKRGLADKVELVLSGCHGFCERGPLVVIHPEGLMYQHVKPKDVEEIITESVLASGVIKRLLYKDPISKKTIERESDVPFYGRQQRLLFGTNALIDPTRIEDYVAMGGYESLSIALFKMRPEEVISEVKKSGLRGRGGGGFPTGRKWEICRNAKSDTVNREAENLSDASLAHTRFVICNADEGDPGAYMDRSLLEGNPHRVIEGMLLGAYGIGAERGYVYVRGEYPLAVENLGKALAQAEACGLLGDNILGSGFNFHLRIFIGAGAFVCGEETAMIASIEGRHGSPRPRPPYPAVSGLWGRPTNVNNVETWANVPSIISKGSEWFSSVGTENSKGTKIFSLVGKINNTGLVEVPMGMTLRQIVTDIGGGIPKGKKFKAVQTGGPSGGCIPESLLDLPIDFDRLKEAGSMMGSGGLIVMDEDTCMVDVARYFGHFLAEESCGKCTPCSQGTRQLVLILDRICEGKGEDGDLEQMETIALAMRTSSLCGLGMTAANPILSVLRHFREEMQAHVVEKRCPAGVCKEMITFLIDTPACKGCAMCVKACPVGAISGGFKKDPALIDQEKCVRCRACYEACAFGAVLVD